jgi:hypothetical protein
VDGDHWICPDCGAEVKVGAAGCPRCIGRQRGKKRRKPAPSPAVGRKSWEQDEAHDGLDLPDEDFDYDEFVAREFGGAAHRRIGIKWWWWLTALLLVAGFVGWLVLAVWGGA